jgi:3-isopropylmalate/(R)-2-methylmalate dehydratase small subunit
MTGRAWIFGDDIDTDVLAPGLYMKGSVAELAKHCLETVDPCFAKDARPGDIVVAGRNFGMGSSREQAVMALRELGISAVLAKSFAGIFYRNAINLGLLALVCPDAGRIGPGASLAIDTARGVAIDAKSGALIAFEPLPPHLMAIVAAGGLLAHLEQRLRSARRAEKAK